MEHVKDNSSNSTEIRGRNFYGNIQIKQKALIFNLTQLGKGGFYTLQVTHIQLQKEFKRFLIFKKLDDLFDELVQNERLQISDENALIIPIGVLYKSKAFELKLQLPLQQRKFNSQPEKIKILLEQLERMNIKNIKIEQSLNSFPQFLNFKGDQTNQLYGLYQVSANQKIVKMLGTDKYVCFNHFCPLKNKGIFYFKTKIIKTAIKYIFFGICTKDIKSKVNSQLYLNPCFMGFLLVNGCLYGNNTNKAIASNYTIVEGQSVITMQIDMNKKIITWFHNDVKLASKEITKELVNLNICPMISLYSNGDCVEFLDK